MHVYACSGTGPARCDGNSSTVTESSLALSRGGGGGEEMGRNCIVSRGTVYSVKPWKFEGSRC